MTAVAHHKSGLNDINDYIDVRAVDQPGAGGGYHQYILSSEKCEEDGLVTFHQPDAKRHGVLTGFTNEAYLAVILHRLECFQAGPFACEENAVALRYGHLMMEAMHQRSARRTAAGIEGKLEEQPQKQATANVIVKDDTALKIGLAGYVVALSSLDTWGTWASMEGVLKQNKAKLTAADVALLENLSQRSEGATRGWTELKQALAQAELLG